MLLHHNSEIACLWIALTRRVPVRSSDEDFYFRPVLSKVRSDLTARNALWRGHANEEQNCIELESDFQNLEKKTD